MPRTGAVVSPVRDAIQPAQERLRLRRVVDEYVQHGEFTTPLAAPRFGVDCGRCPGAATAIAVRRHAPLAGRDPKTSSPMSHMRCKSDITSFRESN